MIKTLNDVIQAIEQLPVETFADYHLVNHKVKEALDKREQEWHTSPAHDRYLKNDQNRLERRQAIDMARHATRARFAREHVKKGMFIKVTGARDGYGIREVVSVEMDGVVCRQWLPTRSPQSHMFSFVSRPGYVANFVPANQMTEHMFDKVAGWFTIGTDKRATLHKIT